MVKFNPFDFGMEELRLESKLFNLRTKRDIRVYGLRNEHNPLIRILVRPPVKRPVALAKFLNRNGLPTVAETCKVTPDNFVASDFVKIGLRRDLRENPALAAAVLQTIVYSMEHRLSLPKGYVLTGLPNFPTCRVRRNQKPAPRQPDTSIAGNNPQHWGWWAHGPDGTEWRWASNRPTRINNPLTNGHWELAPSRLQSRILEPIW